MTTTASKMACTHHWDCEGVKGPTSKAVCKMCGEDKVLANFVDSDAAAALDHSYTQDPGLEIRRGVESTMGLGGDTRAKGREYSERWPEILKTVQGSSTVRAAAQTLNIPCRSLQDLLARKGIKPRELRAKQRETSQMPGVEFPEDPRRDRPGRRLCGTR